MLTRTQLRRAVIEILAIGSAIGRDVDAAIVQLYDAQPGYPTATGGGGTPRLDAAGNPPGLDRFLGTPDPAAVDLRQLETSLRTIRRELLAVRSTVSMWAAEIDPRSQPKVERKASGGDCLACARYCSGADGDRLRAGLCMACRMHWTRWSADHPTADRGDWMLERKRSVENDGADAA